jgi:hypothetical protein
VTDLVERIETTRFLGVEFLIWLWFKSELFEGDMTTQEGETLELWLDAHLLLQSATETGERTVLRGVAPTAGKEAKLALACGKQPIRARVCLTYANQDFALVFDALAFAMSSVALPGILSEDDDEVFLERMGAIEKLRALWLELYAEFMQLRLGPLWTSEVEPALQAWVEGRDTLTTRAYRGMLKRASK